MTWQDWTQTIELYADGDRVSAMCTRCGGRLTRQVPPPPERGTNGTGWNLYDLLDAMESHYAANHAIAANE